MAATAIATVAPATQSRFLAWVGTTDHKRIGILYLCTTFAFFLIGGIEALLMRLQLAVADNTLLGPDAYNQIFTMHGTTMIFLFMMPVLVGFGNYLVPLMIGARDMAFPRLNMFSYWVLLFGGLFLYASFLAGAAPDTGWFSYAPLTVTTFSPNHNIDFWILGLELLGVSSIAGSINFLTTILCLRAPGMSFGRMPLFVWMTFVTAVLTLLAMPSLSVAAALLFLDRHLGTGFYSAAAGGDPLLWQHLFWSFGHPEVYILILPAFGIISEVVPVFSRKPLFGYYMVAYSGVAIGFLSFTVWAHHMFAVGLPLAAQVFFAASSMTIAVPTAIKIFNWIATMWHGTIRLTAAMHFAIGFIGNFIIGGLSGVMVAVVPFDWQATDSYFVVAHMHYVMFGGSMLAVFAGTYYWFPKITGRRLGEGLGLVHVVLTFFGFNLTFLPMHLLGLMGMPRRVYTYAPDQGWDIINFAETVGAVILGIGVLVFLINVFRSLRGGQRAGNDPWDAWTLEWATTSPPPPWNFITHPPVHSARPLWDAKHPEDPDWKRGRSGSRVGVPHGSEVDGGQPSPPPPGPSYSEGEPTPELPEHTYWPLLLAASLAAVLVGVLVHVALMVAGLVVAVYALLGWLLSERPRTPSPGAGDERGAGTARALPTARTPVSPSREGESVGVGHAPVRSSRPSGSVAVPPNLHTPLSPRPREGPGERGPR